MSEAFFDWPLLKYSRGFNCWGGQALVNVIAQPLTHMPIVAITSGYVIFGIVISIVISLLAALAPSRKAAKLDPIEALSAE